MIARTYTAAFEGVAARRVEVRRAVAAGVPSVAVAGVPDKGVADAEERARGPRRPRSRPARATRRRAVNLPPAQRSP